MNIEEIRKGAPDGATHYDKVGYFFHKTEDGYFVFSKITGMLSTSPYLFTDAQLALYGIKPL